jgi:YD repeat-containing protein
MKKLFVLISLILFSSTAFSTVWVRNGNFSVDFTDANEGNGFELTRYYNSLGFSKSFFGYGWGTTIGARLGSVAGILVMVEEIPGGGRSHYVLNKDLGKLADKIITLSKVGTDNPDFKLKLKKKLLQDTMLLFEFAKKYKLQGMPPEGSVLECVERADETIKKIKGGYVRNRVDGTVDEFDNAGRMLRQKFKSGRFLLFSYDQNGNIQSVRDQLGRDMKFYINEKGLLERVQVNNNKVASYKYDDRDDLIEATDVEGNTFRYKYNSYHKMTDLISLRGPGGQPQTWSMKYEGDTGKIVYQKTPDGWETFTEYSSDESKNQYYEAVSVVKRLGNEVASEKYEFWKRPKPDGSTYTYKMKQAIGKKEKTVTYTMCCGTPLVVNDNGKVTRFEYDKNGFLKKKVFSDGRIVEVRYDNKTRIEYIINNGRPYRFQYNERGQMVFAGNDLIKFKLDYDGNGNVSKVTDNKGNVFSLLYDSKSRLNQLSSKYGSLTLNYKADGSASITSQGGATEKLSEIRKAYQEYLDLMMVFSLIDLV